MKRIHYLVLFWLCLNLGLLYPASAGATDTLDQSQPVSQTSRNVGYSDYQQAQIFTAGMYGTLDRVSLYLQNWPNNPAGAALLVSIQTVINGLPSGKQIGSGRIALSAIPSSDWKDWVDVTIYGAVVNAGTQYALVLQTSVWNATVDWGDAYQNQYGSSYTTGTIAFNYGDGWNIDGMNDFTFNTYVIPDVLDQHSYGTSGNLSGGSSSMLAQTFTAGLSGVLDRVRVYMGNYSVTDPLLVTIETVTGGVPSGIVIGQGSIPASSINVPWVSIGISGAIVTAGTQYALVLHASGFYVWGYGYDNYTGGHMLYYADGQWRVNQDSQGTASANFQTYVVQPIAFTPPPPPATITPCSFGICPAAAGSVTPPHSTARVVSNVGFQELSDGTVLGLLNFNDSKTGNLVLEGCTTSSAKCRLTVTTFACTDQHAITVAGTFTPKGKTGSKYLLILSGVSNGTGTFTLTIGDYTYTVAHQGIVNVTCPSSAGVVQ